MRATAVKKTIGNRFPRSWCADGHRERSVAVAKQGRLQGNLRPATFYLFRNLDKMLFVSYNKHITSGCLIAQANGACHQNSARGFLFFHHLILPPHKQQVYYPCRTEQGIYPSFFCTAFYQVLYKATQGSVRADADFRAEFFRPL